MSLPNYLQKIKSAGTYRFVFDRSEIPGNAAETLRLVVGYSEKGQFNTPVYCESATDFRKNFGGISKKMERNGVWFHRLALQALKRGPILALNLKKFDDETVQGVAIDPEYGIPTTLSSFTMDQIYDTNRFWKIDPEHLEDLEFTSGSEDNYHKYIRIAATDDKSTSCSIFVRGAHPAGYDVTVREWYQSVMNGEEVPSFLEGYEDTLVSQYFAEVYVFQGEFTPEIASSEALNQYFNIDGNNVVSLEPFILNAFGEKVDTLQALAQNEASNFIGAYTGSLIPEFQSANGSVIALDGLFNSDYDLHKMVMRLDQTLLYDGGLTARDIDTTGWFKIDSSNHTPDANFSMMSSTAINPMINIQTSNGSTWTFTSNATDTTQLYDNPNYIQFVFSNLATTDNKTFTTTDDLSGVVLMQGQKFIGTDDIATITNMRTWWTVTGDPDTTAEYDIKPESREYWKFNNVKYYSELTVGEDPDHTDKFAVFNGDVMLQGEYDSESDAEAAIDNKWEIVVDGTIILDNIADETTAVNDIVIHTQIDFDKVVTPATSNTIYQCFSSVSATCENCAMVPTYILGYTRNATLAKPASSSMTDKLKWQHSILSALTDYEGLRIALTSNVDVEYRYIVDTFDSYIENELKSVLSGIAKLKDNAILLANLPKMKAFANCDYTSFKNNDNMLDTKYIAQGGNRQRPMSVVFTLPTEENGASWSAFYSQLNIIDPSNGIKYTCPSAALVSNKFMDKLESRQPYDIVAGPDFSRIDEPGLIGPDFNFSREDLNNLEPMGWNCMVSAPGQGTYINANQSAKQNPKTTLSSINVRECVITIQDAIDEMLTAHQWWTNDADTRARIKSKADYLLKNIQSNGGIFDWFTVCSEENNTDEVIDNGMFIIDVSIEPSQGAGKMVQRLYLYRKGGLSSLTIQD